MLLESKPCHIRTRTGFRRSALFMNKVLNTEEHIYTHSNTFIFKIYFKMRSIADIYSIRHSGLSNACLKLSFAITGKLHFILV